MSWLKEARFWMGMGETPSSGLGLAEPGVATALEPSPPVTLPEARPYGVQAPRSTSRATNLTPARLASYLNGALDQDPAAQAELLNELEDRDGHLVALLNTRRLALARLPWTLVAASRSAKDQEIATRLTAELRRVTGWSQAIQALASASYVGWAGVEIQWGQRAGRVAPVRLKPFPARLFTPDTQHPERWRLLTDAAPFEGEALTMGQWLWHESWAKGGDTPAARALGRPLAWMWVFKSFSVKDWLTFSETYGAPIRIARYQPGTSEHDLRVLYAALQSLGSDAAAVLPSSANIEFVQAGAARSSAEVYKMMVDWAERTQSKIVLGQTLTSDEGASGTQALGKVHAQVRQDLLEADAVLLAETISRDLIAPWCAWQFGASVTPPTFEFSTRGEEDKKVHADTLVELSRLGMRFPRAWLHARFAVPEPSGREEVYEAAPPKVAGAEAAPVNQVSAAETTDPIVEEMLRLTLNTIQATAEESAVIAAALRAELAMANTVAELPNRLVAALRGLDLDAWTSQLQQALMTSELVGRAQVHGDDKPVGEWPNVPPEKAIEFWATKAPMSPTEWSSASEGARRRAFVATRLATLNQTQKVYSLIQRSLQEGLGLEGFLEELDADTRASASVNYLEAVYRTNIATAHSVGRYRAQAQPATLARRPFWQYLTMADGRVRDTHQPMHGRVYRADDPIWAVWYPPNGYQDRCRVRALTQNEVVALGLAVETRLPETVEVTPQGDSIKTPALPDPGWRTNAALEEPRADWAKFPSEWRSALGVVE